MTLEIWCAPDTVAAQPMRWGDWVFSPNNLTLRHSIQRCTIRLWDIHTSASMLDWIFQIQNKVWADAKTMRDLLRALQDILASAAQLLLLRAGPAG